jgi:carbon monoxide dehydrogenase subunit G
MKLEHEFTVPVPVDEAWQVLLDVERIAPCMPGATLLSVDGRDFTGSVKVKVGPITVTYDGKATFEELDEAGRRVVIVAIGKETRGGGTAAATVTAVLDERGPTTGVRVETDLNVTGRPAQFGRGVMAEVGAKLVGQFATCLADELAGGGAAAVAAAEAPGSAAKTTTAKKSTPAKKVAANESAPAKKVAAKKVAAKKVAAKKSAPAKKAAKTTPAKKATAPPAEAPAPATAKAKPAGPSPAASAASAPSRPPRPSAEPIDLLEVAGGSVAKRVAPVLAAVVFLVLLLRRRRRSR